MVYVIIEAEFPFSFAVMTAAAVAVGHIRHTMNVSRITLSAEDSAGVIVANNENMMNVDSWNANSLKCHRVGRNSLISILQNVTNSIENISAG